MIGLIANALVRPLSPRWFMKDSEVAALQARAKASATEGGSFGIGKGGFDLGVLFACAPIAIPLAWGVWKTLSSAFVLFH